MTTEYAIDEIRKDAHELTKIAIEDNISKTQVINMFRPFKLGLVNRWSEDTILEEVKKYLLSSSLYFNLRNANFILVIISCYLSFLLKRQYQESISFALMKKPECINSFVS
jgi:hypothetical protein